jgi:hypothetical protein
MMDMEFEKPNTKCFVYVVVTSVLVYVCRKSWLEWVKKPTLTAFFEHDAE